jgi:hypothetical protein
MTRAMSIHKVRTVRNTVCVFVFLASLSVTHSHFQSPYSLSPNFCWLLFCLFIMSIFVALRRSSSLIVTRRPSSLVFARSQLVISLSLSCAHTHTLSLLSTLSLVDCHCFSCHFRSSPSVSLHLALLARLPPSYPFPPVVPYRAQSTGK